MHKLTELAAGVFARTGTRPLETNSGIIIGGGGVTVIDSGYSPVAARALKADIATLTDKPVTTVIITHHHWDHSWGNQEFPGARIVGHHNAAMAMSSDQEGQVRFVHGFAPTAAPWYGLTPEQFRAELDGLHLIAPDTTHSGGMTLHTGGTELQLRYLGPGHTHGDTLVWLPAARVLFAGDMVCNHLIPVVNDGDPFGFARALDAIATWDAAVVVPGHGVLSSTSDVREFRSCLGHLTEEVRAARAAGAPTPKDAFGRVHLGDFAGWNGVELIPGSVRRIYRAIEEREQSEQQTART